MSPVCAVWQDLEVLVVEGRDRETMAAGRIVVGVDGSPASRRALAWAAEQARLTGSSLEVIMAWHVPAVAYGDYTVLSGEPDMPVAAKETLDQTVAETLGEHPDVELRCRVVEGPAAVKLLEAAEGADLLVVGSHGHGVFTGMLLGSVSEHCVTHAHCPVVVLRADQT